jgi:endonuclease-8
MGERISLPKGSKLTRLKTDYVAVQFNGPILKFSESNPFLTEQALMRLGPDPLKPNFSYDEARIRYDARLKMNLADLLLDQTFVAGVGNKYKSELLFLCKLYIHSLVVVKYRQRREIF